MKPKHTHPFEPIRKLGHWAMLLVVTCTTACQSVPQAPLYQRLGGVETITHVSDQVMDRVSTDPRSARSFKDLNMRTLKRSVADYLCHIADGPCAYEGETMRNAHSQSGITAAEFDLMVEVLRQELDKAGVPASAKNELLRRLAPTYKDIIASEVK
jgi:hemoglobin